MSNQRWILVRCLNAIDKTLTVQVSEDARWMFSQYDINHGLYQTIQRSASHSWAVSYAAPVMKSKGALNGLKELAKSFQ